MFLVLRVQESEESLIVETLDPNQDLNVIDPTDMDAAHNVAVEMTSLASNSVQSMSLRSLLFAQMSVFLADRE